MTPEEYRQKRLALDRMLDCASELSSEELLLVSELEAECNAYEEQHAETKDTDEAKRTIKEQLGQEPSRWDLLKNRIMRALQETGSKLPVRTQ